ncbi:hypothetical protein E2C01_036213 [Portunus trituberculatus]|uniref:Uncharacterized protein n=1 Tax=Portunus trituberculatus TaxID=210409 RepID=A0A5B7F572_PORTR|nr:hypothetical protein [Portunus trituberculatus]
MAKCLRLYVWDSNLRVDVCRSHAHHLIHYATASLRYPSEHSDYTRHFTFRSSHHNLQNSCYRTPTSSSVSNLQKSGSAWSPLASRHLARQQTFAFTSGSGRKVTGQTSVPRALTDQSLFSDAVVNSNDPPGNSSSSALQGDARQSVL